METPISSNDLMLSDKGQSLYHPARPLRANLSLLLANELFGDAIRLLPCMLPKPVAVWWGCLCTWEGTRPDLSEDAQDTLAAVLRWVAAPTDENRQAARPEGDMHEALRTPWGALAYAVVWSDGSLTPPHLPFVATPEQATAQAVAGAVLLAAVQRDAMQYNDKYRRFLDLGLHILYGRIPARPIAVRSPELQAEMATVTTGERR